MDRFQVTAQKANRRNRQTSIGITHSPLVHTARMCYYAALVASNTRLSIMLDVVGSTVS